MSSLPLFQVDAFTNRPFAGNPAGICLLDSPRSDAWMQAIAAEMNLSETAFLIEQEGDYNLRWFTPTTEVSLCGHATLASAFILFQTGRVQPSERACFNTRSGRLTAWMENGWISMDFPAATVEPAQPPPGLLAALGIRQPSFIGKKSNRPSYLIDVIGLEEIYRLKPNFPALSATEARSIIVTACGSGEPYDFVSRFFAPKIGINEDPVTGSAHCTLVTYWRQLLGKTKFFAYQASPRGGELRVRLEEERAVLSGQAVTVWSAQLNLEDF